VAVSQINKFEVITSDRVQFVDITEKIREIAAKSGVNEGQAIIFVPHTTAAVTINENADPDVARDITAGLSRLVPKKGDYRHYEGNSDAHIKASILGSSEIVMISGGRLMLGTWQSIYFCEFDGPRQRGVWVQVR